MTEVKGGQPEAGGNAGGDAANAGDDNATAAAAAAAAGTAGGDKGTIAGGGGGGADAAAAAGGQGGADKGGDAAAAAPDWRTRIAGDDKELLKTLGRYTDEAAFGKAHRSLLTKMSSGELKKALPENATPEELASWRKENGIPENPEAYIENLQLPKGLVLGEADKPIAASFAKHAHEKNYTPAQFNEALGWYYQVQQEQAAAREEADDAYRQASEDELRGIWEGPAFRQNLTAVQNLMSGWPKGLADQVLTARDPQGRMLGDTPGFIRQLASLALELNPAASLVPNAGANPGKAVGDRIGELEKMMGNRGSDYWRGPNAEKLQQEYRDLVTARNRMKERAA